MAMLSEIVKSKPGFLQPGCNFDGNGADRQAFVRLCMKLALLGGKVDWSGLAASVGGGMIVLSECEDCRALAARVASIEEKLDRLLEMQMRTYRQPAWAEQSEQRVLAAVKDITAEVGALTATDAELRAEADLLRGELGELAAGADHFLAGLQAKLRERDTILFFELIASVDDPVGRRVKTYEEIGERFGVTRQAIEKRYKKLRREVPELGNYVDAIRRPKKAQNFSEMSPSDRREQGIDESYNYDAS